MAGALSLEKICPSQVPGLAASLSEGQTSSVGGSAGLEGGADDGPGGGVADRPPGAVSGGGLTGLVRPVGNATGAAGHQPPLSEPGRGRPRHGGVGAHPEPTAVSVALVSGGRLGGPDRAGGSLGSAGGQIQ